MPALQGVAKGNTVWVNMHAGTMGAGLQGTCGALLGVYTYVGTHPTAQCPKAKEQSARCEQNRVVGCVCRLGECI